MTNKLGLTLVEIILVLGIIAVLSSFASFNIVRSRNAVSLDSTVSSLINDIKSQQIQAMSGYSQTGVKIPCGIYFETNRYILFYKDSYLSSDSTNFPINLDQDNQFSLINLPTSQIVFASANGEIKDFDPSKNYVTLKNINSGETKKIHFNKFGVVYEIN